jgi:predicted nuclease of predicted toxin-antitoxin system
VKILLDECLPVGLRHCLPEQEAYTVQWAGLKGKSNGELLRSAEAAGYDVLLTVDQGIPQQHSGGVRLSILVIRSRTNQMEDLLPLIPAILRALSTLQPGQVQALPD